MEILVAKHAGFCFGVKRAIDAAEAVAAGNKGTTYVHGQLVHNERVIEDLEKKDIVFVDSISAIPDGGVTVLRAHGEPGTTYQQLEQKHITTTTSLKDATCPLVTLVHNVAIRLKNNGYEIMLFGKKNHPEAIGTSYHIKGSDTFIIEHEDEAQELIDHLKKNNFDKVAILSQTTMSVAGYAALIQRVNNAFENKYEKLHLKLEDLSKPFVHVDTICNPTKQRQSDTEDIAKQVEVMIVIGGLNSSNSKELHQTSLDLGVESHYIQAADQLDGAWFKGKKKVGVTAGASTPDVTIQEVAAKIKELA